MSSCLKLLPFCHLLKRCRGTSKLISIFYKPIVTTRALTTLPSSINTTTMLFGTSRETWIPFITLLTTDTGLTTFKSHETITRRASTSMTLQSPAVGSQSDVLTTYNTMQQSSTTSTLPTASETSTSFVVFSQTGTLEQFLRYNNKKSQCSNILLHMFGSNLCGYVL